MKLNNCLYCCAAKDTAKSWELECNANRHCFLIADKKAEKYNWSIDYIKKEVESGRHLGASLGSAGFTFLKEIEVFKNYAYAIGDVEFFRLLDK